MKVRIKRLYEDAKLPTKAHADDAGFDLYAHSKSFDDEGNIVYGVGVAFEIHKGYVGLLFPRSSNAKKDLLLSNSVGVLDSGYRGEVLFKFKRTPKEFVDARGTFMTFQYSSEYAIGDRIGQIIIMPYPEVEFVEVDELSETERGVGSYGSSGR